MTSLEEVDAALREVRRGLDATPGIAEQRRLHGELVELEQRLRASGPEARPLRAALEALRTRLEAIGAAETDAWREALRSGLRGRPLLERLLGYTAHRLDGAPHYGDEALDVWLESMLGTYGRYDGGASPGAEMIHYDPSPASATLALAARGWFASDEVFVDVGSGTGRVAILAALLGEARCVGVEIDPALVDVARTAASSLGAARCEFRVGDARTVSIDDGTSFFFFAPFVGSVLSQVLDRLEALARVRPIRVGSWGPSTASIARATFLEPEHPDAVGPFDLALFRSRR